jgi:enoyl-CoA hydratase/carnithine racemase
MINHRQSSNELFIELNRPKQFNCQNQPMIKQISELLFQVREETVIERIHLSGVGDHFSSGGDLKDLLALAKLPDEDKSNAVAEFFKNKYQMDMLWQTMPQHTICTAQGIVYGGGCGLLVGSNDRILRPTARLAMPECKLGLMPDTGAVAWFDFLPDALVILILLSGIDVPAHVAVQQGFARFDEPINHDEKSTWFLLEHQTVIKEIYHNCRGLLAFVDQIMRLSEKNEAFSEVAINLENNNALAMGLTWRHFRRSRQQDVTSNSRFEALQQEQKILSQLVCFGEFQSAAHSRLIEKKEFKDWLYLDLRMVSPTVISQFEQACWADRALDL